MNEEDKEHLKALYAGMAMMGWIIQKNYPMEEIPALSFEMANKMLKLLDPEDEGIVKIKKSRKIFSE